MATRIDDLCKAIVAECEARDKHPVGTSEWCYHTNNIIEFTMELEELLHLNELKHRLAVIGRDKVLMTELANKRFNPSDAEMLKCIDEAYKEVSAELATLL